MKHIVFVCSGNTCRSPMAEGILKKYLIENNLSDRFSVSSAGIFAFEGDEANIRSQSVCSENAIDISDHQAKQLDGQTVQSSDYIIAMTDELKMQIENRYLNDVHKMHTLGEISKRPENNILDPFGQSLDVYRKTYNEIDGLIKIFVQRLIKEKL